MIEPAFLGSACFEVRGVPVPQGSMKGYVRAGHVVLTSDNERLRPWRAVVSDQASRYAPAQPVTGPVWLTLAFRLPLTSSLPKRRRVWPVKVRSGDVDKLARGVLDALTGVIYGDDAQVVSLLATKEFAYDSAPGVTVRVEWA